MGIKRFFKNLRKSKTFIQSQKKENHQLLEADFVLENLKDFTIEEKPIVSIIIPVFNQLKYTLNALYAIQKSQEKTAFEILVVNDCSTDQTQKTISKIEGLNLISNPENIGFLRTVNRGINAAKGDYIYLLNNDTLVMPGFLDELMWVMLNEKKVGAVGSKLVYPNNVLQEAGCLIYKNRHIVNLGNGKSPDDPEFNFLRRVDYCSGCSLLFQKKNADGELNLLNEIFAPAYYEETDFCMRLKYEQGLEVFYQPKSVAVHFENISHQNNPSAEKSQLLARNADLFYNRWNTYFTEEMAIGDKLNINKNFVKPSILFIDTFFPEFDRDSGANRMVHLMKFLVKNGHKVYLLSMNREIDRHYVELYERFGIHVLMDFVTEKQKICDIKQQLIDLNIYIDFLWILRLETFLYFKKHYQKFLSDKTVIYDMVDFQYLRLKREFELNKSNLSKESLAKEKTKELSIINAADMVVAISKHEKDLLEEMGISAKKIHVISNIHETVAVENPLPFEKREGIIFIGGGKHSPNVDAILYLHEVMQMVWQKNSSIPVWIIGGDMPEEILKLDSEQFKILGFVRDVEPYFLKAKMAVAPLRFGAGVKGKIGQALEFSLPVITTTIGAEGMNLTENENAMISEINDSQKLAADILRVYTNESLWLKLSQNTNQAIFPFTTAGLKTTIDQLLKK